MRINRPEYLDRIRPFLNKPVIKVLTGMRRVGKSTIVKLLIDELEASGTPVENIIYINKESLEWEFISGYRELHSYVTERCASALPGPRYVCIDEVQEIEGWERAVNSFLSEDLADIVITGSNAHLLASEISTVLSGRYIEFPVYPLTFREFLSFRNDVSGNVRENFALFLRYGGLPGIHGFELTDDLVFPYLNSIYNTLVLKDVVSRNSIKDPGLLDRIIRFVFDNCGNITTAKRISDYLKNQKLSVSVDTVMKYLGYLESAFLVRKARRYDIKGLRVLDLYEKWYAGDIGLRHGFIGYRDADVSGIIENCVYLELLQRGYDVQIGKFNDLEIDFVAERQQERLYVQVAWSLGDARTIEREFGVLEKIRDNFPKIVLTMDEFQKIDRNGICSIYLPDFLLGT